jgi:hypothetical protein
MQEEKGKKKDIEWAWPPQAERTREKKGKIERKKREEKKRGKKKEIMM